MFLEGIIVKLASIKLLFDINHQHSQGEMRSSVLSSLLWSKANHRLSMLLCFEAPAMFGGEILNANQETRWKGTIIFWNFCVFEACWEKSNRFIPFWLTPFSKLPQPACISHISSVHGFKSYHISVHIFQPLLHNCRSSAYPLHAPLCHTYPSRIISFVSGNQCFSSNLKCLRFTSRFFHHVFIGRPTPFTIAFIVRSYRHRLQIDAKRLKNRPQKEIILISYVIYQLYKDIKSF